ncbi:MAG: UDP-N-acetylmuramate--L-alanine ligase, partial [Lachnospiraceae bacterium]|nr:UDP-N-acetylmuramate--L-alanine ligase [Lachnospiraceae bacterium]
MYQIDYHHPVHVYFIGIGGISMSGLAHILKDKSFPVSGSDAKRSEMTEVLEKAGIPIFYGQKEENILQANPKIDVVVYT